MTISPFEMSCLYLNLEKNNNPVIYLVVNIWLFFIAAYHTKNNEKTNLFRTSLALETDINAYMVKANSSIFFSKTVLILRF